ncbi:DUF397 domain-containing protein [Streptomyces cellulosae]
MGRATQRQCGTTGRRGPDKERPAAWVEVAVGAGAVYVRDSKAVGDGPVLRVGRDEWAVFVALAAV